MKLLLKVYLEEWASSEIQAAYVDLEPNQITYLQALHKAFLRNYENNRGLREMVYTDYTPDFLSPTNGEEGQVFITHDREEITIYEPDDYVRLADDVPVNVEALSTDMTITYLHITQYGFEWTSRDDVHEDEVTTYQMSWQELDELIEN